MPSETPKDGEGGELGDCQIDRFRAEQTGSE